MRMNTSIPMMGQGVNVGQSIGSGIANANASNQVMHTNALRNLFQEQGPGIAAGDPNALNALSRFDPQASLGIQQTRQGMTAQSEAMQRARVAGARATAQYAAGLSEQERAQEAAETRRLLTIALPALQQAEQSGDLTQLNQMLSTAGFPPVNSVEDAYILYMQVEGGVEAMETFSGMTQGAQPDYVTLDGNLVDRAAPGGPAVVPVQGMDQGAQPDYVQINGQLVDRNASGGPAVVPVQGMEPGSDGFRMATPEEAAQYGAQAGQFGPDGRFYPINPPSGMEIEVGPNGTRIIQGSGAGSSEDQMNISSPDAMVAAIDGILEDPALDMATGALSWTSNIPGTPMRRFGARANQLDGQAFLQAYNSLRGAGQITEFESQQALRAVGRLDRAQSADDYRSALLELRNILETGRSRPEGWAQRQGTDGGNGLGVPFSTEGAGDLPIVRNQEDYDALLPGMVYRDPQGNLRERPQQ